MRAIENFAPRALALAMLAGASTLAMADTIIKTPNNSAWQPLSSSGTYIYANSFVATSTGVVTDFGTWLSGGSSDFQFKIFGSLSGDVSNGPDASMALASSGVLTGQNYSSSTYVSANTGITSSVLTAGTTYWFAASTIGLGGAGPYYVSQHYQNTDGIVDNGTFWFSNDSTGAYFDGRAISTEIAFSVTISAVPEPETCAMLLAGLGLVGFAARRKRATA